MIIRRSTLHARWIELNQLLNQSLVFSPSDVLRTARLLEHLSDDKTLLITFIRRCQENYELSILKTLRNPLSVATLPHLTHRIWFTSATTPSMPPDDHLDTFIRAAMGLPNTYTHYFWTNHKEAQVHVTTRVASAGCHNIVVMDTATLDKSLVQPVLNHLDAVGSHHMTVEFLKFQVLFQFGGIYSDLNLWYDDTIVALVEAADYGLLAKNGGILSTGFVAAAPQSNLISLVMAILHRPTILDRAYALEDPVTGSIGSAEEFTTLALTASALLFLSPANRVIVLPPQSPHLSSLVSQARSVNRPSIRIPVEEFARADIEFTRATRLYNVEPIFREQLRFLLLARYFFAARATKSCEVFFFNGSDKAMAWHNYGMFYNYILATRSYKVKQILEIGIGTNNLDIPSTMGATGVPGASLRAWKEIFPLAQVVGADVDRRILFQEPGLETYFVDQLAPDTIRDLFAALNGRKFDILLDDGLHNFEANRNVVDVAFEHVSDDGVLVVEDVALTEIPKWEEYLSTTGLIAALLNIQHPPNSIDNCLVFILGKTFQD